MNMKDEVSLDRNSSVNCIQSTFSPTNQSGRWENIAYELLNLKCCISVANFKRMTFPIYGKC